MEEPSVIAQDPTPAPPRLSLRPVHMVLALISGVLLGVGSFAGYQEFIAANPPTPQEIPKPSPTPAEATTGWRPYVITPEPATGYVSYQLAVPAVWKHIEHSSNFRNIEKFQDPAQTYFLTVEQEHNTFASLNDMAGVSYPLPTLTVGGAQALRLLPRAGSEHVNKVGFFTKDKKFVVFVTLERPRDGSLLAEGNVLFDQILSTFTFTNPRSSANETDTSSWTTYAGTNFSFRYPLAWKKQDNTITGGIPIMQIDIADEYPNLMNECAREMAPITQNGFIIRTFTAITAGEMCSVMNGDERQMWFVKTTDSFGPGISISYSASDPQAQQIIDRIAESFFIQ